MNPNYVWKQNTYRSGRIRVVEAYVVGLLRPRLLGLEEQLRDLFVHCAEEALQGPRTFRIELPHVERPEFAGEYPAKEHHLNHVSEAGGLAYHIFVALLKWHHFRGRPPVQTLVAPRCEPHRGPGSELRSGRPLVSRGSVM